MSRRDASATMSITGHLAELRSRIIKSAVAVLAGVIVVVVVYDRVLTWLTAPYVALCRRSPADYCGMSYDTIADDVNLFTLDPVEGLTTRLRVATYGGVVLALPILLWQLWRFIVPALHRRERGFAIGFVLATVILFVAGGLLAYSTLDRALEFLIGWSGEGVDQAFRVSAYVRLVTLMIVAFGVGFTVPVLLVFLQLVGILTPRSLVRGWRYAVVGTVFIAAAITPSGDPISLATLSVPMVALYFAAAGIGRLLVRRRDE
ncbi:MAG: twin-arginine translocase subunit TatC [Ilumatobacteraceae bacterium]|jgi:sec-independent protein translocase protein TatC|nr:twin-arginine translocase subunit TatC [Ilumatobacteraceae bacterium]